MRSPSEWLTSFAIALAALMLSGVALAQDVNPPEHAYEAPNKEYSPFVNDHFPTRVLWGDTHLHTSWSVDAGFLGGTLGPAGAYRASMGQEVTAKSGFKFKLIKPLDFVVVSDHAESFGLLDFIERSDPLVLKIPLGKQLHDLVKAGKGFEAFQLIIQNAADGKGVSSPEMMRSAWEKATTLAEEYNQPGVFTALIGYEFSPHPAGNNLTGWSSSGTTKIARIKCFRCRHSIPTTPRTCGNTWPPTRKTPADASWPRRITAICPTA